MATVKPTIALVPGAWHSPVHYEDLLSLLEKAGYETKAIQLPSVDSANPKEETVASDAEAVREKLLLPLLDAGKDVLLVMHSYGGFPGSAAARGLSKKSGKTGSGIVGLVYIAAFIAPEGASLLGSMPTGEFDPWVDIKEGTGQLDVYNPADVFYHDVPEEKKVKAVKALKLHSQNALSTPGPPPAWVEEDFNGRRGYIRALQDRAIPPIAQEMMVKLSGVDWNVKEIDAGHSLFLSRPQEVADSIVEMATAFEGK